MYLFHKIPFILNLYNHSDFVKMHMHNAWLLEKDDLTISLPVGFFTEPKYVYIFCGNIKLTEICDNSDTNNFDFHTFLFACPYLMIDDAFILKLLKTSGEVSFHCNNTLLPSLYAMLNLNFNLLWTQSWFKSRFPFYNSDFVSKIRDLTYQDFRRWWLNFEHHNVRYQEHFYNDFLGRAHCDTTCDICAEHDDICFSNIRKELSCFRLDYLSRNRSVFRPFACDFKPSDQIFQTYGYPVTFHICSSSCHTFLKCKPNFYSFTYRSILIFAYYTNLTKADQILFRKCHTIRNNIYKTVIEQLSTTLEPIYGKYHLDSVTIPKLSVCEQIIFGHR